MKNQYEIRHKCFWLIFTLVIFTAPRLFGQDEVVTEGDIVVSGTVIAEGDRSPLPGVSVVVKNTTNGVSTDFNGNYTIEAPADAILVFSYIGFKKMEVPVERQTTLDVVLNEDTANLDEVVVTGFATQDKKSITGAITTVSSEDLEGVRSGSTVSTALAGKLAGVTFRQPDGRPGATANIQIRNMGNPLFVIDGITQDANFFNQLAQNDIESISILKDASAAVYGVRAANGVVLVTTKKGRKNTPSRVNVDAFYGLQNWSRFPEVVNDSYQWQLGKAEGEINEFGETPLTPEELERYRVGTERGYQSFNWKDFIIKGNAPQTNINANVSGGSEKINYYLSASHVDQESVMGEEFSFYRSNIQSNIDVSISDRLKVGAQISGRQEVTDTPGIPGFDDYFLPRFAILRNRPFERPYANDNPDFLNDIGHNETNWALHNKEVGGYRLEKIRVAQANFTGEYQFGGFLEGLSAKGIYSYSIRDRVDNGHEYTYDAYTYDPETDTYNPTGGSTNPWRSRNTDKEIRQTLQGQLQYKKTFAEDHNVEGLFVVQREEQENTGIFVRAVPETNVLPLIYFPNVVTYNDGAAELARIGYIGKVNYNYKQKYFFEFSGRQDKTWKFAPGKRTGFFPNGSVGWRLTEEDWYDYIAGEDAWLTEFKLRASYGVVGDDDIGIGPYDYLSGYSYDTGRVILNGQPVITARDRGQIIDNITWFESRITDIGFDFAMFDGKLSGSYDWFYRLRTGLRGPRNDVLLPNLLGYNLPDQNVNSDSQQGFEGLLTYANTWGDFTLNVSANGSYARGKFISSFMPRFNNSLDEYYSSREGRWDNVGFGFRVIGQFESQDQINNYPVDIDGEGNRTLLPGDLIYEDINNDGSIGGGDAVPNNYQLRRQPMINFGLNITADYKNFDIRADFSGASGYSWEQNFETKWPYQNTGALNSLFLDSWRRADPFDINSEWTPGKYPPLRFNSGGHSNYRTSDYWTHNVTYLRARTLELGYTLPKPLLEKMGLNKLRFFVNGNNLFSFDNLKQFGVDPEVNDENGLQYPQNKIVSAGFNISI